MIKMTDTINKDIIEASFVFVNYNTSKYILEAVESICSLKLKIKFEIIIVDNFSDDFDVLNNLLKYENVKLIRSKSNEGFGHACNFGVKHSAGKYCVFINPDTKFRSDIFISLRKFYESKPDTGFVGGILINEENKPIYSFNSFPGYYWELLQAAGFGTNREIQKLFYKEEIKKGSASFEVDWLIGAFLFVSRKIFDELNGFDERFFLYYEDVDIQYRAKLLGYKNYCLPDLRLVHYEKGSVKNERGDDVYHFYMYKSKMMYYYLHFSFFKRNVLRIFLLIGLFFRLMFLLPRKSFNNKKKKFKQYQYMLRYFMGSRKTVFENKRI